MRKLGVVGMFVLLASVLAFGSSAAAVDGQMTSVSIDGTDLFIDHPSHWESMEYPVEGFRAARSWLKQYPDLASLMGIAPDASPGEIKKVFAQDLKYLVLFAADTDRDGIGDGDNVLVKLYRNVPTVKNLAEWRAIQRVAAETTDSEVVSDATRIVDGHRAFTHIERYPGGVVSASMEINLGRRKVLSINQVLDRGGEDLAQAIMDSVHS